MTHLHLRRFAFTLLLPLAALLCAPAPARAQVDPIKVQTNYYSVVGVTRGQAARVNTVFHNSFPPGPCLPPGPCFPPGPCDEAKVCAPPTSYRATLNFLDDVGNVVATRSFTLAQDRGAALVYAPASVRPDGRAAVRASIVVEPDGYGYTPQLVTTTEVFDLATGQTSIINPGDIAGFNPQPEPPGDSPFGFFGVLKGQTARVNVANVGAGSGELPPGPCRADVVFYDGNGLAVGRETLWLAPGQTGAADFATANQPDGWRGRVRAEVHVEPLDGRSPSVVAITSLEVFAADTGRSALFYPGALLDLR